MTYYMVSPISRFEFLKYTNHINGLTVKNVI